MNLFEGLYEQRRWSLQKAINPVFRRAFGNSAYDMKNSSIYTETEGAGVPDISDLTTEASTDPTSASFEVPGAYSGVDIFLGNGNFKKGVFFLHVKISGTTHKIMVHRWQKIFVKCTGTIYFGTSDLKGNTFQQDIQVIPSRSATFDDINNNAVDLITNFDFEAITPNIFIPGFYTPSEVRVSLNTNYLYVEGAADPIHCFISEYDGTNWTEPVALFIPANRDSLYLATYKKIAIATSTGASVNIKCDGTIEGSQYEPYPSFTVTNTRTVTTSGELVTALTSIVDGTDIVITVAGTYTITGDIATDKIFRLRNTSGGTVTVVGSSTNNGRINANSTAIQASPSILENITFNNGSVTTGTTNTHFYFNNFNIWIRNCIFSGNASNDGGNIGNSLFSASASGKFKVVVVNSTFQNAGADVLSIFDANPSPTDGYFTVVGTTAFGPGSAGSEQAFTCHGYTDPDVIGCRIYELTNTIAIANGSAGSPSRVPQNYLYFCDISGKGTVRDCNLLGCKFVNTQNVAQLQLDDYAVLSWIESTGITTSSVPLVQQDTGSNPVAGAPRFIVGCTLNGNNELHRGLFLREGGYHLIGNYITELGEVFRIDNNLGPSTANAYIVNNYIFNNGNPTIADLNYNKYFYNNIAGGNTTFPGAGLGANNNNDPNNGSNKFFSNYNILSDTRGSVYVLGANDTTSAAELTGLVPNEDGNAFYNGATVTQIGLGFIGSFDIDGNILFNQNDNALNRGCYNDGAQAYANSWLVRQTNFSLDV